MILGDDILQTCMLCCFRFVYFFVVIYSKCCFIF